MSLIKLNKNNKWVVITTIHVLISHHLKYHPDGAIACQKACMVARGFTQAYGIDYNETFSHVVRL